MIINDLVFDEEYIKYVDDATVASVSLDPLDESLQRVADGQLKVWTPANRMVISTKKTKEMLIYFGHKYPVIAVPLLHIDDKPIERVSTYKLLGIIFNNRLTWDDHVEYIVSKASKRIFCITKLVRSHSVNNCDIIVIYCSIVRSILEYCEVWHPGLSGQQSRDIERVQKRCLKIIYPEHSYSEALSLCGLERLDARRERLVCELFQCIKNANHILYNLLTLRDPTPDVRFRYPYVLPLLKTVRARHDFINYCLLKRM